MAPTNILKHDDNIAQQIVKQSLKQTARLLRLIGKPFYILLITSINLPIIIYYTIRHFTIHSSDIVDSINKYLKNNRFITDKRKIVDTNFLQKKADLVKNKKVRLYEIFNQNGSRASRVVELLQGRIISKAGAVITNLKIIIYDVDTYLKNTRTSVALKTNVKTKKLVNNFFAAVNKFIPNKNDYNNFVNYLTKKYNKLKEYLDEQVIRFDKIQIKKEDRKLRSQTPYPENIKSKPGPDFNASVIYKITELASLEKIKNLKHYAQAVLLGEIKNEIGKSIYLIRKKYYVFNKQLGKFIKKFNKSYIGSKKQITKTYNSLLKKYITPIFKKRSKGKDNSYARLTANISKDNLKLYLLKIKLEIASVRHAIVQVLRTDKPKVFLYIGLGVLTLVSFTVFTFWLAILKGLPSPNELTSRDINVTTKIYDRNGILLYNIYKDQNRSPVTLSDIPSNVKLATIAIEDAEFYTHPGFSIRGIARAFKRNIERGQLTGGSTITQQLVKNALLSSEKTVVRKVKELTLAVQVELTYNKDQILEMYLNEVSYGGTAYGVQEAARMYYDKDVSQLTLAEAALLAGLPKSPTQFSPFGPNPVMAKIRQKQVLNLMQINGFITQDQANEAGKEEIQFAQNKIDIKAPHFVMYVRSQLEEKYGKEVVEKGGLEVITTLDYSIQQIAEGAVREEVDKLARLNVGNGSAIVLNPTTGEILAMVGSKNYFDTANDGNVNIATSLQSPGSSIKVVNYAYALSNGYTPATIVEDTPITYQLPAQPPYIPRNYDGQYKGKISIRSALAESRNIPAVKVLNSYGVANMIELGRKMGITTWENPNYYGLALTLGGGDIKLIDLAQVYATIANYGKRPDITTIKQVTNYKGKVLDENKCQPQKTSPLVAMSSAIQSDVAASDSAYSVTRRDPEECDTEQVIDPRVAFILTDILKDNNARSPAFGSNSQLVIENHKEIAVKTGTSNELRDNLTIGYNQNYLVAVWVGNNDNSPMSRIASGVTGAAPIFNRVMTALIEKEENHDWEIPLGLVKLKICSITGTLPCEGCPSREEWFLEDNQPNFHCSKEFFEKDEKENEDEKERGNRRRPLPFPFEVFNYDD